MKQNKLKYRSSWQRQNQNHIGSLEWNLYNYLNAFLVDTDYQVIFKPQDLRKIYTNVNLNPELEKQIYQPLKPINAHGLVIDYLIINQKTNKRIYIELKKQSGWVEGKKSAAGRGNAHERGCKFFAPGLIKTLQEKTKIVDPNFLPFVIIYAGDISCDPKRVREITFWFDQFIDNYWFWSDQNDLSALKNYLFKKVLPKLD